MCFFICAMSIQCPLPTECIQHPSIISSCQSAATSEVVKHFRLVTSLRHTYALSSAVSSTRRLSSPLSVCLSCDIAGSFTSLSCRRLSVVTTMMRCFRMCWSTCRQGHVHRQSDMLYWYSGLWTTCIGTSAYTDFTAGSMSSLVELYSFFSHVDNYIYSLHYFLSQAYRVNQKK